MVGSKINEGVCIDGVTGPQTVFRRRHLHFDTFEKIRKGPAPRSRHVHSVSVVGHGECRPHHGAELGLHVFHLRSSVVAR